MLSNIARNAILKNIIMSIIVLTNIIKNDKINGIILFSEGESKMNTNAQNSQRSNISLEKPRPSSANTTAEPIYTEYRAGQSNYRSASPINNSQMVQTQYHQNQNNYQSNQSQYPQNLNNYRSNQPVYQQYQNNTSSNQSQYEQNRTNAQTNQSYYQQNQNNTQTTNRSYYQQNQNNAQSNQSYYQQNQNNAQTTNRSYYQQNQNNAQSNQSYYQQNQNNTQTNRSYYQQNQNNAQPNQSYYQQNRNNTQTNQSYYQQNQNNTSSRSGQYTPPDYIPDTDTNINNNQLEFSSSSFLNRFTRSGSESPAMGYFLGIVGALIGAIPGAILIILLGTLGYAACVSGAVLFLGVFYLYRMLSGSVNNFDKIDWTIVIGVCVIGVFLSVKASYALKISILLGTSFGDAFSNLSEILTLVEIKGKFIISLIITYLFAFVGATKTLGASLK